MALSAAERARKYRANRNADPLRRERWLEYQREKYKKDHQEGKRKHVKNMNAREHRKVKREWKKSKRIQRKRAKDLQKVVTPPDSAAGSCHGTPTSCTPSSTCQDSSATKSPTPGCSTSRSPEMPAHRSRQRNEYVKKKEREKKLLERKVATLEAELEQQRRKAWLYKKRMERQLARNKQKNQKLEDTPRKKADNLVGRNISSKTVRRTLVFHFSLLEQIKQNYQGGKKSVKDIRASNTVLQKYGFKTKACKALGIDSRISRSRPKKGCLSKRVRQSVKDFFLRDDVSRLLSGKNRTVTRKKVKKQKRILCDSITNLHLKYLAESLETISFTTFWRLKPFFVVYPSPSERETCLCKTCENAKFMAECLFQHGVIETAKLDILVGGMVCSPAEKNCMYRECEKCKDKTLHGTLKDSTQEVSWTQWKTFKKEKSFKGGETKELTVTEKEKQNGSVLDLWDQFRDMMSRYCRHSFTVANQYNHLRHLRDNLQANECIIHIDFSENYVCKMHKEVQSVHFGASQVQLTLHTGCYYVQGKTKPTLFCGVSDSLRHDPSSVWAFLHPVLTEIKKKHPSIKRIHFFSDGPTSQYRQKQNFYLFATELHRKGFEFGTWNFFAARHGKGIPDAVGGIVKRTADRGVLQGWDITSSDDFVRLVQPRTSVKLYKVLESSIMSVEGKLLAKTLRTLPGTMKLHQVLAVSPLQVQYRDVSCRCSTEPCPGHSCTHFCLAPWGSLLPTEQNEVPKSQSASSKRKLEIQKCRKMESEPENSARQPKQQKVDAGQSSKNKTPAQEAPASESLYEQHLEDLKQAQNFLELQHQCKTFVIKENIHGTHRYFQGSGLIVDSVAKKMLPEDCPKTATYPAKVIADGDCLPGCGSVFAFGDDKRPAEMRVRIVHELALNPSYYLNEWSMRRGLPTSAPETENQGRRKRQVSVLNKFAMFSEEYIPGTRLNEEKIRDVYEKEVLKVSKKKEYMGIWQVCALSSVLRRPIFSVYPNLGNPSVRADLHRLVLPRPCSNTAPPCGDPLMIMWCSTRTDMTTTHWVPNHFVPLIENEPRTESDETPQAGQSADDGDSANTTSGKTPSSEELPLPEDCLGHWVVVRYDQKAYPGMVLDVDEGELYIQCMHQAGGGDCFFWPKMKDLLWYEYENILAVISEPVLKDDSHDQYIVDPFVWASIMDKLRK